MAIPWPFSDMALRTIYSLTFIQSFFKVNKTSAELLLFFQHTHFCDMNHGMGPRLSVHANKLEILSVLSLIWQSQIYFSWLIMIHLLLTLFFFWAGSANIQFMAGSAKLESAGGVGQLCFDNSLFQCLGNGSRPFLAHSSSSCCCWFFLPGHLGCHSV